MGCRLHYAKKYDVRYGGDYFNHRYELINELLKVLVEQICGGYIYYNQEDASISDALEIDKTYLADIIKSLQVDNLSPYLETKLNMALKEISYTRKEFVEILQEIYENSAPEISYVRLEWY